MPALLEDQGVMFSELLQHVAGLMSIFYTEESLRGRLLVNLMAFGLFAASKTDLLRCAES